jgi:hypothetical protein
MNKRQKKKNFKKWERRMVAQICRSMEISCQKTADYFQQKIAEAMAVPEKYLNESGVFPFSSNR